MASESMTPPYSPSSPPVGAELRKACSPLSNYLPAEDNVDADSQIPGPVCFNCLGEVFRKDSCLSTRSGSFLKTEAIVRLIAGEAKQPRIRLKLIDLFGFKFSARHALSRDLAKLFFIAKQRIVQLEQFGASRNSDASMQGLDLRRQLKEFFDFIAVALHSDRLIIPEKRTQVLTEIQENIRQLVLHVGLLCRLPVHVIVNGASRLGNQSSESDYHVFHSHLEVWWACIEILHIISTNYSGEVLHSRSIISYRIPWDTITTDDRVAEFVQLFVWSLISLGVQTHNSTTNDVHNSSMFSCGCVRELIIMLIHLLQHRYEKYAKQSFWSLVVPVLQYLLQPQLTQPTADATQAETNTDIFSLPLDDIPPGFDAVGFCWLFLWDICPLYRYNVYGDYSPAATPAADNPFLLLLIQKSISSTEVRIRSYLHSLLHILAVWDINAAPITALWDHFYRRLNDQFLVPGSSISNMACINESSSSLFERCRGLVEKTQAHDNDNSYFLFLRLLGLYLGKSGLRGQANQEWRQMKGRIVSKFSSRKMHELNDCGLQNVTCLFLVLAQVADLEDVACKLSDLYGMLNLSSENFLRRAAVWRGTLAFIQLYIEMDADVSYLADKMSALFNEACLEISRPTLVHGAYADLWRLFNLYLEGTQEIIDSSTNLSLHEGKLIGEGFQHLLPACRENELRLLLSFLQAIFTKHRIVYKRAIQTGSCSPSQREFADALWKYVYRFVQSHAITLTPPPQLADIAASFALLSMDILPRADSGVILTFPQCFSHFARNDQINTVVSCRFLSHMMPNQAVIERLSIEMPALETFLVSAWLRCCWRMNPQEDQIQQLTRQILRLQIMPQIFLRIGMEVPDISDNVPVQFIKAIGLGFNTVQQDFQARIDYRNTFTEFFGDAVKHVNWMQTTSLTLEQTMHVYSIAGNLFKHCSQLIYVKSIRTSLLPDLIDKLYLSRSLLATASSSTSSSASGGESSSIALAAMRQHLHLFVQGLSQLDFKKDSYVQGKLRELVVAFLPRFQKVNNSTSLISSVHPLLIALSPSLATSVTEEASSFRQHFLEIVHDEFLIGGAKVDQADQSKAWSFLTSVFEKTKDYEVILRDSIFFFLSCLENLLFCENTPRKQLVLQMLRKMTDSFKKSAGSYAINEVKRSVSIFLSRNLQSHQVRTFKVLETLADLHPALIAEMIPELTRVVVVCETKRGVGVDKHMRITYYNLLSSLGEMGNAERTRLIAEIN